MDNWLIVCEILPLHPYQTLLEIDYDTVIDDEDVVDEFAVFKSTLEGWLNDTNSTQT